MPNTDGLNLVNTTTLGYGMILYPLYTLSIMGHTKLDTLSLYMHVCIYILMLLH